MNFLEKIKKAFPVTKQPLDNGVGFEDFGSFLVFALQGRDAKAFKNDFLKATGESPPVDSGKAGVDFANCQAYIGKYIAVGEPREASASGNLLYDTRKNI
jgi:hypothetical protein